MFREYPGASEATVFFLYDGNCNVDAVVDEDGALVRESTYDVFGAVRETLVGSGGDTVGFSGGIGHMTDLENSLVYMRARYYEPSLGRFISEDPGKHGANWYVYCVNNPVNMVDPTGNKPIPFLSAAIAVIGAYLCLDIVCILAVMYGLSTKNYGLVAIASAGGLVGGYLTYRAFQPVLNVIDEMVKKQRMSDADIYDTTSPFKENGSVQDIIAAAQIEEAYYTSVALYSEGEVLINE